MDPDAALALLLDAIAGGDTMTAAEHFEDLTQWLNRGGFPPAEPRNR